METEVMAGRAGRGQRADKVLGLKKIAAAALVAVSGAALFQVVQPERSPPEDRARVSIEGIRAIAVAPHYARALGVRDALPAGGPMSYGDGAADMLRVETRLASLSFVIDDDEMARRRTEGRIDAALRGITEEDALAYARAALAMDDAIMASWNTAWRGLMTLGEKPERVEAFVTHAVAGGVFSALKGEPLPPEMQMDGVDLGSSKRLMLEEGSGGAEAAVGAFLALYPDGVLRKRSPGAAEPDDPPGI